MGREESHWVGERHSARAKHRQSHILTRMTEWPGTPIGGSRLDGESLLLVQAARADIRDELTLLHLEFGICRVRP